VADTHLFRRHGVKHAALRSHYGSLEQPPVPYMYHSQNFHRCSGGASDRPRSRAMQTTYVHRLGLRKCRREVARMHERGPEGRGSW
jgi:hypothetical protein